ncbi:MAG: NifB/NifX family molybdenum-iron cluster-binding protein, partial [Deltaproteobacteria bacterium]|nr:NifB/NifX family molybdenum-iron cluster-binding protein [Deltaproteobacteria bacterium]
VAIPVWDDKISPVLDTASRLWVVDLDNQGPTSRFEIFIEEQDLSRRCLRIIGSRIDTLICGAVSRPLLNMLESSGINIIPGIAGHRDDVLDAYIKGTLFNSEFLMPGYDDFRRAPQNRGRAPAKE